MFANHVRGTTGAQTFSCMPGGHSESAEYARGSASDQRPACASPARYALKERVTGPTAIFF